MGPRNDVYSNHDEFTRLIALIIILKHLISLDCHSTVATSEQEIKPRFFKIRA